MFSSERLKAFPLKIKSKVRVPTLTTPSQHSTEFLSRAVRKENNNELSEKFLKIVASKTIKYLRINISHQDERSIHKAIRHQGKKLKTQTNRYFMFIDGNNEHYLNVQTTESNLQIQCSPAQNSNGIFYINRTNNSRICMVSQFLILNCITK